MATEFSTNQLTINQILTFSENDRTVRAYAFLYTQFLNSETADSPIRDVVDCLIPFIVPFLQKIDGKQVNLQKLQFFLEESFGFKIPLYALEQILPTLENQKLVSFKPAGHIYIATAPSEAEYFLNKEALDTDLSLISQKIAEHAKSLSIMSPPISDGWDTALIKFLKFGPIKEEAKIISLRGTMLEAHFVEDGVVAGFISRQIQNNNNQIAKSLVNVFAGIQIEDFISAVSEIGIKTSDYSLTVFLDTSILMRQLGCSNRLLNLATRELIVNLHEIGIKTHFLPGNEEEVAGIIDAILSAKDSGYDIQGETAEALSSGEITIAELRILQNNFIERLSQDNVLPISHENFNLEKHAKNQINESALVQKIREDAKNRGRPYSLKNAQRDASYIGEIMRLRGGLNGRDLMESEFLFVTNNKFLASTSRKFLIREKEFREFHVPPALHTGQVSIISWLLKKQKLTPQVAERDLLCNCYAALRPNGTWFEDLKRVIEGEVGSLESFTTEEKGIFTIQAARRIAKEESFGNPALVRQIGAAELIGRAEKSAKKTLSELKKDHSNDLISAEEKARCEALLQAKNELDSNRYHRASTIANQIVLLSEFAILASTIISVTIIQFAGSSSWIFVIAQGVMGAVAIFSTSDMLGFDYVKKFFDRLRHKLTAKIEKWLKF